MSYDLVLGLATKMDPQAQKIPKQLHKKGSKEVSPGSSSAGGSVGVKISIKDEDSNRGRRNESENPSKEEIEVCSEIHLRSNIFAGMHQLDPSPNESEEKVKEIWSKPNKNRVKGESLNEESKYRTEDWAQSTFNSKHVSYSKKFQEKLFVLQEGSESSEEEDMNIGKFKKMTKAAGLPSMKHEETKKLHKLYREMKKGESRGKANADKIPEIQSRPATRQENITQPVDKDKTKKCRSNRCSKRTEDIIRSKSAQKKIINPEKPSPINGNAIERRSTSTFNMPSISQANFQRKFVYSPNPIPDPWSENDTIQELPDSKEKKEVEYQYDTYKPPAAQESSESKVNYDYSTLKVSNLPSSTKYADLELLFPEAISMTLPTREVIDWESKEVNVFAYILFATVQECKAIKKQMSGRRFRGHDLIIEYRQTF